MQELVTQIFGAWAGAAPTVTYCEVATGGFIARPGYAISNIPYMLLGLYLLIFRRDEKLAKEFGMVSLSVGISSFIYDASFTLLAQTIDLAVMFTFVALLAGLNLQRIFRFDRKIRWTLMLLMTAIYTPAIIWLQGSSGRILFGVVVVFTIFSELYLSRKESKYNGRWFLYGLIAFIVGFAIWLLDANQIWCDPTNIFNGRAVYHYLTTFTIWALWRHYSNLKSLR